MAEQNIPQEDITRLEINSVSGSLHLSGWNRDMIRISNWHHDEEPGELIKTKNKKTVLQISSPEDLIIHLPHSLDVTVKSVSGDANLRGLDGELKVESISGDMVLRDVGSISLKILQGALVASRIRRDLRADSISGDCLVNDVQGQVELKDIKGDVQLEQVDGGFDIQAAGDGLIIFHPVPWQAYRIKVKGDLSITMPDDSDADLSIQSEAEDIRLFPGKSNLKIKQKEYEHQLGEGGTSIQLFDGGLKVADAAVDQLGAAARGALAEVVLFEQQGQVAPRGRLHRHPQARRAPADNQYGRLHAFGFISHIKVPVPGWKAGRPGRDEYTPRGYPIS